MNEVLNCTDPPQPCEYCGADIPPNSDHQCDLSLTQVFDRIRKRHAHMKPMPMTPHQRAAEMLQEFDCIDYTALRRRLTTAFQAQSNDDEQRAREKRQALRARIAQLEEILLKCRDEFRSCAEDCAGAPSEQHFAGLATMISCALSMAPGDRQESE